MTPGPRPLPVSSPLPVGFGGVSSGVAAFLVGLKLVTPGGGLFRYALGPVVLSAFVLVGLVVATFFLVQAMLGGWLEGHDFAWLSWVGGGLAVLIALILSYFLFSPVMTLFGPLFLDPICERVHIYYTGQPLLGSRSSQQFIKRQAFAVVQALKWAAISLFIELPLMVVAAFTVVGLLFAGAFSSLLRGVDLMDYPLALRHLNLRQKLHWSRRRPWPVLGLGAACSVAMLVPVVNLFVIPAGAVGATILMLGEGVTASLDDDKPKQG